MVDYWMALRSLEFRLLFRNIAWLSVASIIVKPIWFVFITFVCARLLGADGYGALNTALSLGVLCFVITSMGVNEFIVREVAAHRELASRYLSNFLILRLFLIFCAGLVTISVATILGYSGQLMAAVIVVCLYQSAQSIHDFSQLFFQAFEDLRYQAVFVTAEKLLVVGGGALLLIGVGTVPATLIGMTAGLVVVSTAALVWTQVKLAPFRRDLLDLRFVRQSLRPLIPFGLAAALGLFFFRIDTVIVEALLGLEAAGQYGLGFRIVEALNMLPFIVVMAASYPRFSREWRAGKARELRILVRGIGIGLAGVSVALAIPIMLWAPMIIEWIAGASDLLPAAEVLTILVWAFPLTCIRTVLYAALLAMEAQVYLARALGAGVLLNIALNLTLIPMIGIAGAAVATIISEVALLSAFMWRYTTKDQVANV